VAGKGGGAWKVAYADFVTAMMAFFLVMWLCSQDQKVKRAVADYFGDPLAIKRGSSKSPNRMGSVFEALNTGSVPQAESVNLGRGRDSYSPRREGGRATKVVSDWIANDAEALKYWREQAQKQREAVKKSIDAGEKIESTSEETATQLGKQLKEEMMRGIHPQLKGVYQDLLGETLGEVKWTEIAEDLLRL
jgi:flagellar motor protein MotB